MATEHNTADDSTETGWSQMGSALLHRGWSIGKKVAIAGAALSVAPVVVPPLLLFSAFGFALSVPFGIYYTGIVGTERLMQYLLPIDQGQEAKEWNQEESEMVEEGKGDVVERDFEPEKNAESTGDDARVEIVEEGKPGENGEREDDDAIVGIPSERDSEKSGEREGDGVVQIPKERDAIVEEIGGIKKDGVRGDTDSKKVIIVERITDGNNTTVDKDFITMETVEIKPKEVTSTTLNEEVKEIKPKEVTKKGENDPSAVSSEDVDLSEVDGKSDSADAESKSSREHAGDVKDLSVIVSATPKSPVTSDEELYTKKQLWDQLRSLRIIVGLKAPICKTLPDELRALYVFTGVELPSTATDASNLLDLNYKVQFLKSVIGVK